MNFVNFRSFLLLAIFFSLIDYPAYAYIRQSNEAEIVLESAQAATYFKKGFEAEEKGGLDQAEIYYQKCIQESPLVSKPYFNLAYVLSEKKKYNESIKYYTKYIEIEPNDPYAFNNRGYALEEIGEVGKAIADYRESISLAPEKAFFAYSNRLPT